MTNKYTNSKEEVNNIFYMDIKERAILFEELKDDILKKLVKPAILKIIWSSFISLFIIMFTASGIYYTIKSDVFALKQNTLKLEKTDIELWKQKSNKTDLDFIKRELDNIKDIQLIILNKLKNE